MQNWGLISHSFGGYLAAKYKLLHPEVVNSIIFECPTFDLADSARSLLEGASQIYKKLGNKAEENRCREICEIQNPREIWNEFSNTLNQLDSHKDELYVYGQDKNFFDSLVTASGLSQEEWGKASVHQNKLYTEGLVFESLLNQLDEIECPMLLIKGETDWVSSNNQVQRFLEGKGQRSYVLVEKSGHFPRFERSDVYVNEIRRFVTDL